MAKVVIRNDAFVGLISSCVEVYRKEAFGIVFGYKKGEEYVVKEILPFQTARRGYTSASLKPSKEKALNKILACMSKNSIIGDYHSHPGEVYETLSGEDVYDIVRRKRDYISLLVSIKVASRYQKWKYTKDGLTGTVGKYYFKIKAFEFDYDRASINQIKVECPIISKLNKNYKEINKKTLKD
tara:strand:- start:6648 stop:7196 length:549 start_codon:yes stop_codon:yes gene_type:complete